MPPAATKSNYGKIGNSQILPRPAPSVSDVSEVWATLSELIVQVWLLYHHLNCKCCSSRKCDGITDLSGRGHKNRKLWKIPYLQLLQYTWWGPQLTSFNAASLVILYITRAPPPHSPVYIIHVQGPTHQFQCSIRAFTGERLQFYDLGHDSDGLPIAQLGVELGIVYTRADLRLCADCTPCRTYKTQQLLHTINL